MRKIGTKPWLAAKGNFIIARSSQEAIKLIWSLSKRHFIYVKSYYISDGTTMVGALGKYMKFMLSR